MTYSIDPPGEARRLAEHLDGLAAVRERLGAQAAAVAEGVSAWSPAQHLYHIALATDLALRNVQALLDGKSPRIVQAGEPEAIAVEVFGAQSYPRGASEAPRMVQPPAEVEEEYLSNEMLGNRTVLAALERDIGQVKSAAGRIRHHALGALNAAEWLLFARLHANHHLEIVHDIERALPA